MGTRPNEAAYKDDVNDVSDNDDVIIFSFFFHVTCLRNLKPRKLSGLPFFLHICFLRQVHRCTGLPFLSPVPGVADCLVAGIPFAEVTGIEAERGKPGWLSNFFFDI